MDTTSHPTTPSPVQPPGAPMAVAPRDFPKLVVSPVIQRSFDAFRAALPELLKGRTESQAWVAFCGEELVTFGRTKAEAYQICLDRGFKRGTFIVMAVTSEVPEFEIFWDDY